MEEKTIISILNNKRHYKYEILLSAEIDDYIYILYKDIKNNKNIYLGKYNKKNKNPKLEEVNDNAKKELFQKLLNVLNKNEREANEK